MNTIELVKKTEKFLGLQLSPIQRIMLAIKLFVFDLTEAKIVSPSGSLRCNRSKIADCLDKDGNWICVVDEMTVGTKSEDDL